MKILSLIFYLLFSIYAYSQTKYYTTNGKNRYTEEEMKNILSEMKMKMEKASGKKFYTSVTEYDTRIIGDSIIAKVNINVSDEEKESFINAGPLTEYKDKPFPEFSLQTLDGATFNSKQLNGKPTLINFWFTKCLPCIDEMPVLNEIAEKYKNDFNFVAITFENEKDVNKFLKKHAFHFLQLVDAEKYLDLLGIEFFPLNVFLDKDGNLKYVESGIPYTGKKGNKLIMGEGNEIIEIIEKMK